jgi:hypothetical protein
MSYYTILYLVAHGTREYIMVINTIPSPIKRQEASSETMSFLSYIQIDSLIHQVIMDIFTYIYIVGRIKSYFSTEVQSSYNIHPLSSDLLYFWLFCLLISVVLR